MAGDAGLERSPEAKVARIRTTFLLSFYNPWYTLGIHKAETRTRVFRATPQPDHLPEEERTKEYHFGRIHSFLKVLQEGVELDPIDLGISPEGLLVVTDGNHRLIAHALARREYVSVRSYPIGLSDLREK